MNNTIVPDGNTKFVFYADGNTPIDLLGLWKRNSDKELSEFRLKHFNFIFQSTNLMRNFTAYENISLTRMLQGYTQYSTFKKASGVLAELGLSHIDETRMAHELSGGQQQRLAFARAIIPEFTVLFGDEPTGNLDGENATKAMELLTKKLEEYTGSSAIIVSHDMHLAATFGDVIIKISKKENTKIDNDGEVTFYGLVNKDSAYTPSEDRSVWTNGKDEYSAEDFENFLRQR